MTLAQLTIHGKRSARFWLAFPATIALILLAHSVEGEERQSSPPDILFIGIDDLNDWVGPLGGHPDVLTPNLDRLAARGLTFTNAHCQSPLCNPSRGSLMTSLRPSTTGIYGLGPFFRNTEAWKGRLSLNQFFRQKGYETYSAGKIYHGHHGRNEEEFDHIGPPGGPGVLPEKKLVPPTPAGNNPWVDWGLWEHDDGKKLDHQVADWCVEKLANLPEGKPVFLACGFFLPHVPCYVTSKWWNLYDHDSITLPPSDPADRLDCSPFSWYLHWRLPEPRMSWLEHHGQHRNLVHAYLASISYVDAQVGRVLDALEKSGRADRTIICLWSDHGYHLGEKGMMGKTTLWERSTRVPLIFAGPGIPRGKKTSSPAELLDLYPTLAELCGFTPPSGLDGLSLLPQIRDPGKIRERPAITVHNPGNQSIRGERYRLILYADGSEELYDLRNDPAEATNLVRDPAHRQAAERLRRHALKSMAPLIEGSRARILERREDGWYWENERIDPDRPPQSIAPHVPADLPRIDG